MKNTFGNALTVTLFGESHGAYIGATLDGLAPGLTVDMDNIRRMLSLRAPRGSISTARHEEDEVQLVSGVADGITTGTPLTLLIQNGDTKSGDYAAMKTVMRPSHADYPAQCKYHGFQDTRGGGHFSGRITAALVAAGAICHAALQEKGVFIGTHLSRCAGVEDRAFGDLKADIKRLSEKPFPALSEEAGESMKKAIAAAGAEGDSVGGVLETAVIGLPAGVGEPWFDTVEGVLAHMLFSGPAVKGVEFGDGFALADKRGSAANDAMYYENGVVTAATNHGGGIGGGITSGMPLIFRCAVKPTPSIAKEQKTVDIAKKENTVLTVKGRHDPAVVHRARAVVDAATAIALCDLLTVRFGTDFLAKKGEV